MNGILAQDVIDNVEIYNGISVTDAEGINLVNQASARLGGMGLIYSEERIDILTASSTVSLPIDCLGVMYALDENDNIYFRWTVDIDSNEISFASPGVYTLALRKLANTINSLEDEVEMHQAYTSSLTSFAQGLSKLKDDDNNPDGHKLLADGERVATQTFNSLVISRAPAQARSFPYGR